MSKDRNNPLALSSENPNQDLAGFRSELKSLKVDFEAKRKQSLQTQGKLILELRHLREKSEKHQQRAVKDLVVRQGFQKDSDSCRYYWLKVVNPKGNKKTHTKLEKLLWTFFEQINGKEECCRLQYQEEFKLAKATLLYHLLKTHGGLFQGLQSTKCTTNVCKGILRKLVPGKSNSRWRTMLPQTDSALLSSAIASRTKPQHIQRKKSSAGYLSSANYWTSASNAGLHLTSLQESCHPYCSAYAAYAAWDDSKSDKTVLSKCMNNKMENGTDYGFLVRQNSHLLQAIEKLERTCTTLQEENCLLRKNCAPEEKVRRLRRKNTELAVLAKRLEERACKLQEANLKVVKTQSLLKGRSMEQYKRAFTRQQAQYLAEHASILLSKDKEIAALQQKCIQLETCLGIPKGSLVSFDGSESESLLRESQKEVLRLQRQLSVASYILAQNQSCNNEPVECEETQMEDEKKKIGEETPNVQLDDFSANCKKTTGDKKELGLQVTPALSPSPTSSCREERIEEQCVRSLESELHKKRKECENLEHEVKKRHKRCQDLESQLEDDRKKNEQLKEEADLLRRKAQLLDQTCAKNEELRENLSKVTAQHISVLEENQRLRAKLENLDQVLKHMREVAERRQQLELEHEQALAILKFKQDEIKRLQRAQLFAKREHEGVVQMLENTLDSMQSKVRELEEKCRSQSEQFGLLFQELEKFRLQASKTDMASSGLLTSPSLSVLTNGVGLTTEQDYNDGSWGMVSLGEIAFWSLEGGDPLSCPEANDPLDVAAALRIGATPHAAALSRVARSSVTKHRELPTISVSKSSSVSSKSDATHHTPKSDTYLSPHKSSPTREVDTASEVEDLDIDIASVPYTVNRGAAKLQVFIARYSYNPYDGPNDNPEVELPLTAGEYIYVYGGMDDDGFYEGELMDGRRGLVPSNFVERILEDDMMSTYHPETGDMSHNSLLESSLHSASHQPILHTSVITSERTEALTAPAPLTNGLDLDLEEVGVDSVPYPRKLTLIKQLAKSIIIGWDPPLVPAGWGNVWSYNVYVDQELRLNVPFGSQTKAVLERLDINLKAYRVSVQSLTEKGLSDQLCCSMLVGRDVCVAPTQLRVEKITATSAMLSWLPSNSNYVHIVSLNEEEFELVKAGCYSLCLSNLLPSLQYTVKVEARPHRTPWEIPVERREHRCTTITFTTLMAGPPDAPLDVQLEHGPSPGIALISWLPVTIDAAGTSNGVRVTGYTIYVDKKKVLEVSSPTAGSVLLGPSQIHSLQAAQELTVRTTSVHSESCDSLPVNVPSILAAIMTGSTVTAPGVPASTCTPTSSSVLVSKPFYGNSAAKVSALPLNSQIPGLTVEAAANMPHGLHSKNSPSALYMEAWAKPSSPTALALSPVAPAITQNNMTSATNSATQTSPTALPSPTQQQSLMAAAPVSDQCRDTDSPGTIHPFPSIADFLDDPTTKLTTPERIPTPPKSVITDFLNPPETNLLRPPSTSPLDSEVEDEIENTRLVSIEEFIRTDHNAMCSSSQQNLVRGLVEPPCDYLGDNSLSDILEEEEEDLYSDQLGETQARGYSIGANRLFKLETPESDEDVVERIIRLPPQVYNQLFSIPEVTEEEDSLHQEPLPQLNQPQMFSSNVNPQSTDCRQHAAQIQLHPPNPSSNVTPHQHIRELSYQNKETLPRQGSVQVKSKTQHRVHYADTVDTINYPEENMTLYEGPKSNRVSTRCPSQITPSSKDRGQLRGLGDRLRREAMLRSQMAAATTSTSSYAFTPKTYPVGKTVQTLRSPVCRQLEIDVEYGADDSEGPKEYSLGKVVKQQMSSEWWVEGAEVEHSKPQRRGWKADLLPKQAAPVEAGLSQSGQTKLSCKSAPLQNRQLKGNNESTNIKDDGKMRIFVALFQYDPVTMSPNPDAAEEELPFSEGQIIKIYGDKDTDGFYRGESAGRLGFVPCNMVSEIQVEDQQTRQQLLQQGFLSTAATMEKTGTPTHAQLPRRPVPPPKPRRSKKGDPTHPPPVGNLPPESRRMVAIFDYDPRESSPNTDIEAELTFSAGDIIHVFGGMDEDGFFYGDLNGQKGFAPSNYLQDLPVGQPLAQNPAPESKKELQETLMSSTDLADLKIPTLKEDLQIQKEHRPLSLTEHTQEPQSLPAASNTSNQDNTLSPSVAEDGGSSLLLPLCPSTDVPAHPDNIRQEKRKTSFFSKGRNMFKRLGFSKKE